MNKTYKKVFDENQKHNEQMLKDNIFGEKISKDYASFEQLYVDTVAGIFVDYFKTNYGENWQNEFAKYMQRNEKRFDYIFNPGTKKYNSYNEMYEDIKATCNGEFVKEDNKELFKKLEKLLEKNPAFKDSLNEFCTACEKNPGKAFEMTTKLANFATMIRKAYLRYCIYEIVNAQHQR